MADAPLRIATISNNPDPNWAWLRDLMAERTSTPGQTPRRTLEWESFSTAPQTAGGVTAKIAARLQSLSRLKAGRALAKAARDQPFDVIVSHGPWSTAWAEATIGKNRSGAKHLAFAFNYTNLPSGPRLALMKRTFRSVDAFAVFTDAEQELYADLFGIDKKKIIRAPWGVAPPLSAPPPRAVGGLYFAALGGEARDYATLCETARRCPDEQFIAIARAHNFEGLSPPQNLRVEIELPFDQAWALVYHAEAALIPLRSRETPCGLVTLVGGMHLGKAQIVTAAAGVLDYVKHDHSGLLTPPGDAAAMAAALKRLQSDPALTSRLGENAHAFASAHCSEDATVAFFETLLARWFG